MENNGKTKEQEPTYDLRTAAAKPPSTTVFSTDCSKAISLFGLFFVRASVVLYVAFVLSWFVLISPFFWCFVTVQFPG